MGQCWAYNTSGQRCSLDAGHDALHTIMSTWSDDECFSPIVHQLPKPQKPIPQPPLPNLETPAVDGKCVACSHKHRDATCKCGCYEFIG